MADLLDPASPQVLAFAESGRRLPATAAESAGGDQLLLDETPDDSSDLAAARAVAAVAACLCGTSGETSGNGTGGEAGGALFSAARHWQRAHLPAFDGGQPFPDGVVARLGDRGRDLLRFLDTTTTGGYRGFLVLLALHLVGAPPSVTRVVSRPVSVSLPVVFDRGTGGVVAALQLTVLEEGPPGLHPDPETMAFFVGDRAFEEAVRRAWTASRARAAGACVTWSIRDGDQPCHEVRHGSVGAAFAVGLRELDRRGRAVTRLTRRGLDPRCAVTGALDEKAVHLLSVGGHQQKLEAAEEAKLRRVVVPAVDLRGSRFPEPANLRVVGAATVSQAAARARRRPNLVLALLAVVVLVAGALVVVLDRGRQDAEEDARLGELARQSQSLARESRDLAVGSPNLAKLLAISAYRTAPTAEAFDALSNAISLPGIVDLPAPVVESAFTHDGRLLLAATVHQNRTRGALVVWDRARHTVADEQPGMYSAVAVSHDGTRVASVVDGVLRLWTLTSSGTLVAPFDLGEAVDAEFSPTDGALAVAAVDGSVELWRPSGDAWVRVEAVPGHASDVEFAAAGRTLLAVESGQSRLWTVSGDRLAEVGAVASSGAAVAVAPDGDTVAIGMDDGTVSLWPVGHGEPATVFPAAAVEGGTSPNDPVEAMEFSPDGSCLAVARAGTVSLRAIGDGEAATGPERVLGGHTGAATSLAYSSDGRVLAVGSWSPTVSLWDVTTPAAPPALARLRTISSGAASMIAVGVGPTGRLVTVLDDGTVAQWSIGDSGEADLLGQARLSMGDAAPVVAAAVAPTGAVVVVIDAAGSVRVYSVEDPDRPRQMTALGNGDAVAVTPDGRRVAVAASGGEVRLWDQATPAEQRVALAAGAEVTALAITSDGRTVAAADRTGAVRTWSAGGEDRQLSHPAYDPVLPGVTAIVVEPSGRHVLSVGADTSVARLATIADEVERLTARGATLTADFAVAVGPTGSPVVTPAGVGVPALAVWQPSGDHLTRVGTLSGSPVNLRLAAVDGRGYAVAGSAGTLVVWDTVAERVVDRLCRTVGPISVPADRPVVTAAAPCG